MMSPPAVLPFFFKSEFCSRISKIVTGGQSERGLYNCEKGATNLTKLANLASEVIEVPLSKAG